MALDEGLRTELAKPFGNVMDSIAALQAIWAKRPRLLVAVGDETIYRLIKNGVKPDIGVFDLKCHRVGVPEIQRQAILSAAAGFEEAGNPPGEITRNLAATVDKALMEGSGWIKIDGEDDLSALLFMAHAPDGTVVLYGQPGSGMVWVDVDAKTRSRAVDFLIRIRG